MDKKSESSEYDIFINKMSISNEYKEVDDIYSWAKRRIEAIYKYNSTRIQEKENEK